MLSKITYELCDHAFLLDNMVCIKSNTNYDISSSSLPLDISDRIDMLCRGEKDEQLVFAQYNKNFCSNFVSEEHVDCPTIAYVFNVNCQ